MGASSTTAVNPALPECFCWTRYGPEAGESIASILERKEAERQANGGVFLWGIGNSLAPSVDAFVGATKCPMVFFSPIRSEPRPQDVAPTEVVRWRHGLTIHGERWELPPFSVVTSRNAGRRNHYALVCYSDRPLTPSEDLGKLEFGSLLNLVSGRRLGFSQVTAIVRRKEQSDGGPTYPVSWSAQLRAPYFVRLTGPTDPTEPQQELLL